MEDRSKELNEALASNLQPTMERLTIQEKSWLNMVEKFKQHFFLATGSSSKPVSFFKPVAIHMVKGSRTVTQFYISTQMKTM